MSKFRADAIWGIGAQAFQALGNLVVGLIILKTASKTEYGLYGIGVTLILQGIGIANALVIMPLNFFAPTKRTEARATFCSSLLLIVILILFPLIVLTLGILTLFSANISAEYLEIFYVSGAALAGILLLEFFRVYFYVENSPKSTFNLELTLLISMLTGLFFVVFLDLPKLHHWAIGLRGFFAFLLAVLAWIVSTSIDTRAAVRHLRMTLTETIPHSLWSLGGVLMSSIQTQFWIYLLAYSWGADHVAEVLAAFLLLSPVNVISNSIWRVFLPRMTKWKHDKDTAGMLLFAKKALAFLIFVICVYAGIILISFNWVSDLIVSDEYNRVKEFLILGVLYYAANYFRTMSTNLLQIYRQFKRVTLTSILTSFSVFICSFIVVKPYQAEGLILVMTCGELLLGALLYSSFRKTQTDEALANHLNERTRLS